MHKLVCSSAQPENMNVNKKLQRPSRFEIKTNRTSFESVLMRWMKLEPIIQSEVSQKDKDHYNILTHIYGI